MGRLLDAFNEAARKARETQQGNLPIEEVTKEETKKAKPASKMKLTNDGMFEEVKAQFKPDNFRTNVARVHKKKPFFYDKKGLFWFWDNKKKCYIETDDTDIINFLEDVHLWYGIAINPRVEASYLKAFQQFGRRKIPQDAPVKWVQFKNKAYSVNSSKVYQVKPNYFFTNPIPWELGTTDKTPVMDKLFGEWVGKENINILYELIAYCTYRDYPIHLIFCLMGSGRNGKSQFLKIIKKFLSLDNVCSSELDTIINSRFETFSMYKKLATIMGETNFGVLSHTSMLKKLVGGDLIRYEKKRKDTFNDYNYSKIIIASNSLPTSLDTSDGFYRRWMIIDFPNEFPEGKDIVATIPEKEYNNLALKTTQILKELLNKGKFHNQGEITERRNQYIMASNPLPMFLKEFGIFNDKEYIEYNELYNWYLKYLKLKKKRKVSRKEFKMALEDEGYWVERTTKREGIDDNGNPNYKLRFWVDGLTLNFTLLTNLQQNSPLPSNIELNLENSVKVLKVLKKEEIIHHPCSICGAKESHGWNKKGKPICNSCSKSLEVNEEQVK